MTGRVVTAIDEEGVTARHGDRVEHIAARTVIWAAGVQASPLGRVLAERAGAVLDRAGRVMVEPDLTIPGHAEILVIGDLAISVTRLESLAGRCSGAMQEGRYAADLIRKRLAGETASPFHYRNKGNLATIGRAAAVADFGRIHIAGPAHG